ncbi:MAG TPA: capsule assembly Wzi family protein [Lunatimonas sp.]|nr:capsule assembly Wzi family protein [Lunatimonas sp.]
MVRICIALLVSMGSALSVLGQSIPAGFPMVEEYLRRSQLLEKIDPNVSFLVRPVYPREISNIHDAYSITEISEDSISNPTFPGIQFFKGNGRLQLLPLSLQTEWNLRYPYPVASQHIPNRGWQTFASGGLYLEAGPLEVKFQPEYVWAQNKFYDPGINKSIYTEYEERFGNGPYRRFLPGQSSVRLNAGPFSVGYSTENIWWGPGQFNALLFSNNAFGFEHLTFNTRKPVKTFIGYFETQVIAGYLKGSEFMSNVSFINWYRFEDRYLNGFILTYQPKWTPGLSLGVSRVFQQYNSFKGDTFSDYFPIFAPFQKVRSGFGRDAEGRDQQATVFFRWAIPEGQAEFYFEFGRRDHEATWRGALLNPEHARAFLFGFNKLFPVTNDAHIQTRFELFHQQESINILARYPGTTGRTNWGGHTPVIHGFTHRGQMIGPGIGPGSNVQTLETSWVKGIKKIGLRLDRLNRYQDRFVKQFNDFTPEQRWVDLALSTMAEWKFNKLLISSNVTLINSLNYQWQMESIDSGLVPKGKDMVNFQGNLKTIYLF